jgi:hypothetical protein
MQEHIHWLALAVAALATQIIGFIWYNSKVFGPTWMQTTGVTEEKAKSTSMAVKMLISLVLMFAVAYQLKYVAHGGPRFTTFKHGAFHAFFDGVRVVIPIVGIITLYEHKGWKYFLMTAGYWMLCFITIGGIISWWR